MAAAPPGVGRAAGRLIGYYLALAGIGLAASVLGPTLPGLAAQTGTTLSGISFLFVARTAGYLSGSWVVGRLYDRLPGHPIMAGAAGLLALGLLLSPLVPWLWVLAVVMMAIGAAEAGIDLGSNTLLVWTYRDRVGPYMNGLHFAFGVGAFLAPLIVERALAWGNGISWAYWIMALLVLPPALWLLRWPSPAAQNAPAAAAPAPVRAGLVALLAACFFFYVGAETGYGAWLFSYARAIGLTEPSTGAFLTSAFWGAITLGRLASIPLAARLRPRTILTLDLLGSLASASLAAFAPGRPWVLWVSAIGTGLCLASFFPTLLSFASRRVALTGRINSLFFIGANLGNMALPWLIGQWFEPVGAWVMPAVVLAGLALDSAAFAALVVLAPAPTPAAGQG
ncbi:MAG: MFS transporter [Anaerolineales bacterium]|nr:MFS transporter [Anaerolineales bacterium]